MKRKNQRILKCIGAICFIALLAVSLNTAQTYAEQSSFDYKIYKNPEDYKYDLSVVMKDVSKKLTPGMDEKLTCPIPGLTETCYVKDGKTVKSDGYVPQGLCSTGEYWLTTAYDGDRKGNSVVYAVDKKTRKVVSTLTLPNKYHVGGIAFDGKRIWLTGATSDKYSGDPFVQYIDYGTFKDMIKDEVHAVSKNEMSGRVYMNNKPSFLECDDGKLWVGTYIGSEDSNKAYLNGYEIVDDEKGVRLNTLMYTVLTGIDSSAQGCDIEGDYLYVSSSYLGYAAGVKSSYITKYNIAPVKSGSSNNLYVKDRAVSRVEVPKMNEEILVEDDRIIMNFESGSNEWWYAAINTDRLLAVKQTIWGKNK